jgi:hypothetical protein
MTVQRNARRPRTTASQSAIHALIAAIGGCLDLNSPTLAAFPSADITRAVLVSQLTGLADSGAIRFSAALAEREGGAL